MACDKIFVTKPISEQLGAMQCEDCQQRLKSPRGLLFPMQRMCNSEFYYNKGVPIYLSNQNLHIANNIRLYGNVAENGGGIVITNHSNVTFHKNAIVNFTNNTATNNGGAIFLTNHSSIVYKDNSTCYRYLDNNMHGLHMKVINNTAQYGGAIYVNNSSVIFGGCTSVAIMMVGNNAEVKGGAIYSRQSIIVFSSNSTVTFNDNIAYGGRAMYIKIHSTIIFEGTSNVMINGNGNSHMGSLLSIVAHSSIMFRGNSTVTLMNNVCNDDGGALFTSGNSTVIFEEYSTSIFSNNSGTSNGGGLIIDSYSNCTFRGRSTVNFAKNSCGEDGGALLINLYATVTFEDNSIVTFLNNTGNDYGGAMHITAYSNVTIGGNTTLIFHNNNGNNIGGALAINEYSSVKFEGNSSVTFNGNKAYTNAGVVYADDHSVVVFKGNSKATFKNNIAEINGGTVYIYYFSAIIFEENSTVIFYNNEAKNYGAVVHLNRASFRIREKSNVYFNNNRAERGGALYIILSNITVASTSLVGYTNNTALQDGGAIYLSDHSNVKFLTTVLFCQNTANDYGNAIYMEMEKSSVYYGQSNHLNCSGTRIAKQDVFINVPKSCNSSCLHKNFRGINKSINFSLPVATSPAKLKLYDQAKCITGNNPDCDTYYMTNIMLGENFTFDACALDYYDQPTKAAEVLISGMDHQDYNISGPKHVLQSCNHTTQAISITGNLHSNSSYNYSLMISLYITHISDSKLISVKAIIELSQCHPGYWYNNESQKCECYDTKNIVSCSGSSSTIKRGYWFGIVTGKPTVTSCPNNYCNFTCCEITNGIYHLSPVRVNQCRPHRSGTACGDCNEGYTLSFDSPECIDVSKCTVGQTVLVTTLSLLYWVVAVVAVFIMTHLKVTMGSLYGIVYYYSIVDILLGPVLFTSNGLYRTVSIPSSLGKLAPQFLGQLIVFDTKYEWN